MMIGPNLLGKPSGYNWYQKPIFNIVKRNVTSAKKLKNTPFEITHRLPDFPVIGKKAKKRPYRTILRGKTWRTKKR